MNNTVKVLLAVNALLVAVLGIPGVQHLVSAHPVLSGIVAVVSNLLHLVTEPSKG